MKDNQKWLDFEQLIDLHKFYFENLIRAASFSFGIIGAFLAYIISIGNTLNEDLIKIIVIFPISLSIGTSLIFAIGILKTIDLSRWVIHYQKHELHLRWRPHAELLIWMSVIFTFLFLSISIGTICIYANPSMIKDLKGC